MYRKQVSLRLGAVGLLCLPIENRLQMPDFLRSYCGANWIDAWLHSLSLNTRGPWEMTLACLESHNPDGGTRGPLRSCFARPVSYPPSCSPIIITIITCAALLLRPSLLP